MNCPKCKSENQNGNFCGNCGEKLKKKCPECGKIESIDRTICVTKYNTISDACRIFANSYANKKPLVQRLWWLCYFTTISGFIAIYLTKKWKIFAFEKPDIFEGLFVASLAILVLFLAMIALNKKLAATNEGGREFIKQHPEYAEILKKAEEGNKEH